MRFDDVSHRLPASLRTLPGLEAQRRMAPVPRTGWKPGVVPERSRPAAALIALFPFEDGEAGFLLTKRSASLPKHRGQVSLPGGAVDADETIEQAALREAHEEVGLEPGRVCLIGALTPIHIPVSGFLLHPVVGTVSVRPSTAPAPGEVSRIIEVRLGHLLDAARHRRTRGVRDGLEFDMPYFDLDGEEVWGATAMVLAEFAALFGVDTTPRE